MLQPNVPAVILAPMEGVTDAPMRAVQGAAGAFTFAVTEFLRVSHAVPPRHVYLDHMPELRTDGRTLTGLRVQLQLLGGDAGRMAEAAARGHELGAAAIDINFGCPAPTVNRHDGGAALLRHPKRIREIVGAIRAAVPAAIPVSAKLRLGWDGTDAIDENAAMAAEGGASWLTIHGRTRVAGYAPPVFWKPIGRVRERLGLPVVANGDIWTLDGFRRCREETGSIHFMLGRGALADPLLARRVAGELGIAPVEPDTGTGPAVRLAAAAAEPRRMDRPVPRSAARKDAVPVEAVAQNRGDGRHLSPLRRGEARGVPRGVVRGARTLGGIAGRCGCVPRSVTNSPCKSVTGYAQPLDGGYGDRVTNGVGPSVAFRLGPFRERPDTRTGSHRPTDAHTSIENESMSTTHPQPAPESYATFWAPLVGDRDVAPVAVATVPDGPGKAKDAYLEFTEVTEGVDAVVRTERS